MSEIKCVRCEDGDYKTFQVMYKHVVEKEMKCKSEEETNRKRSGSGQGGNHKID